MTDKIQFRRVQDWTVVYVNGQFAKAGDHYLADEWLQERCGVEVVDDDAGLCIPDGHNPLKTLAEVEAAELDLAERQERARRLREQGAELYAEAERVETGASGR